MIIQDWIARRDDNLNPVLVKEVRQCFHSSGMLFASGLLLLLELLLLAVIQFMGLHQSNSGSWGWIIFVGLLEVLILSAVLVGSFMPAMRYTAERRTRELDFSTMINLSPWKLISGKLASSALMIGLLYSLCLPFMVIAYFMRGVTMVEMLALALFYWPALLLAAQTGILFGASGHRGVIGVYMTSLFGFAVALLAYPVMLSYQRDGGGLSGETLEAMAVWGVLLVLMTGMMYMYSVAAVSHVTGNRVFGVRIYTIGMFVVLPLLAAFGPDREMRWNMFGWFFGTLVPLLLITLSAIAGCERRELTNRVLEKTPRMWWRRWIYFLLSSGVGGGVALTWILMIAYVAVFFLVRLFCRVPDVNSYYVAMGTLFYAIFYAELTLFLRGIWTQYNYLPPWLDYLLTVGAIAFIPVLIGGMASLTNEQDLIFFMVSSPGVFLGASARVVPAFVLLSCFFALGGLYLVWPDISRQFRDYKMAADALEDTEE